MGQPQRSQYQSSTDKLTPKRAAEFRGQVTIPTAQRLEKSSDGFDVSVLIEGAIPVVRARERSILTPPEVRREMIAEAIADMRSRGRFEIDAEIRIKETAADRLLNPAEHDAICRYIRIHAKVATGHTQIGNYGQQAKVDRSGQDEHDRPLMDVDKAIHAFLGERLPEAHLAFLEWLAWHEFAGMKDGVAPSQVDIGKVIIDSKDARRAQGGSEGFLRAVAQNVAHWMMEAETLMRRNVAQRAEYAAHRKKVAR